MHQSTIELNLLVDCLTKAITVSDNVKEEIQETLLLPMTEIEKCNRERQILLITFHVLWWV